MRLIREASFSGVVSEGGTLVVISHAAYTLPVSADLWVEVEVGGLSMGEMVDLRCVVAGKKARPYVPESQSTYAPAVGFPAEDADMNFRTHLGPVFAGCAFGVELIHVPSALLSGTVRLWAVDAMNALNVAMPSTKAADSVLEEVHLAKAALVNLRTHDVPTGVNTIKDDDGETTLVTLTPGEADGVVTIVPS